MDENIRSIVDSRFWEWVFSGIGVAIALAVIRRISIKRQRPSATHPPEPTEPSNIPSASNVFSAGGDISATTTGTGVAVAVATAPITIIQNLSDLDDISSEQKQQLGAQYENLIQQIPGEAKYHIALGLYYLDLGLYTEASRALNHAHMTEPLKAEPLYYLALAECAGRRPASLKLHQIKRIERYLKAAIALDPHKAQYLYLWAQIKYDFYQRYGLELSPPSAEKLVKQASRAHVSPSELQHLLKHLSAPDNPITRQMNTVI